MPFSYVRENELPVESEDAPLLPEPDEALELHADDEGFRCEPGEREKTVLSSSSIPVSKSRRPRFFEKYS